MINFYYWGYQCPYNASNIKVLKEVEAQLGIKVVYIDVSHKEALTKSLHLFSPTLTVVNGQRIMGPITFELIKEVLEKKQFTRKPYIVESKNQLVVGKVKALNSSSIKDTSSLCCSFNDKDSWQHKSTWLHTLQKKYSLETLGCLHYHEGKCVGGVEFVPSLEVPYDIPKDAETAFLTCVHTSDKNYDYKKHPLTELEEQLKKLGFKRMLCVASVEVAFPNGPLQWFLDGGFEDLGLLHFEVGDHAAQHLVEKIL